MNKVLLILCLFLGFDHKAFSIESNFFDKEIRVKINDSVKELSFSPADSLVVTDIHNNVISYDLFRGERSQISFGDRNVVAYACGESGHVCVVPNNDDYLELYDHELNSLFQFSSEPCFSQAKGDIIGVSRDKKNLVVLGQQGKSEKIFQIGAGVQPVEWDSVSLSGNQRYVKVDYDQKDLPGNLMVVDLLRETTIFDDLGAKLDEYFWTEFLANKSESKLSNDVIGLRWDESENKTYVEVIATPEGTVKTIATQTHGRELSSWPSDDGQKLILLEEEGVSPRSPAFLSNYYIRVYDLITETFLYENKIENLESGLDFFLSPNGDYMVFESVAKVYVHNISQNKTQIIAGLDGLFKWTNGAVFFGDNQVYITGYLSGNQRVLFLKLFEDHHLKLFETEVGNNFYYFDQNSRLFFSQEGRSDVEIFKVKSDTLVMEKSIPSKWELGHLEVSPDGDYVFLQFLDDNEEMGTLVSTRSESSFAYATKMRNAKFSPDNKWVALYNEIWEGSERDYLILKRLKPF
ncbi:MAG: WD40 repeat domain-containing protein [Pseudobdellovibrionaceae bacterium]|nr:WD40 repeat domain-containing protein [Bdellovibrionales bacterium]USN46511.1 MAG: WD40 repeat domain-containing protein [Pseudobdellovibrionaceae bacterium]